MSLDKPLAYEIQLQDSRRYWDNEAAAFDDAADHGLHDPHVLAAWTTLLKTSLPAAPAAILDMGCGTGSLSVVLAGLGHNVTGIDLSPAMIARAEAKALALNQRIHFHVMDAAFPQSESLQLAPQQFDVLVCRHLLWALPERDQVLERWGRLLKPSGRLLLIEGYWKTGGLHSQEIIDAMPSALSVIAVRNLSGQAALWGCDVTDERYAILADLRP